MLSVCHGQFFRWYCSLSRYHSQNIRHVRIAGCLVFDLWSFNMLGLPLSHSVSSWLTSTFVFNPEYPINVSLRRVHKGVRGDFHGTTNVTRHGGGDKALWGEDQHLNQCFIWQQLCSTGFPPHPGPQNNSKQSNETRDRSHDVSSSKPSSKASHSRAELSINTKLEIYRWKDVTVCMHYYRMQNMCFACGSN